MHSSRVDCIRERTLREELIMPTPLSPAQVTVKTTSGVLLPQNPLRHGCVIQNLSNETIALSLDGTPAKLGYGINLTAKGIWIMDSDTLTTNEINGIATNDAAVSIQEYN